MTDEGLVLERGKCLRHKLRSLEQGEISIHTRLQWAREAAEGLYYIHSKDIIHADVGCHNLILDRSGHLKFIDFAGSGIDGKPALVCYEWCSYQPGSSPDVKTDISLLVHCCLKLSQAMCLTMNWRRLWGQEN